MTEISFYAVDVQKAVKQLSRSTIGLAQDFAAQCIPHRIETRASNKPALLRTSPRTNIQLLTSHRQSLTTSQYRHSFNVLLLPGKPAA